MSERPTGAELLAAARSALLQELVTDLPEQRRYLALMIANAMAIAARELELGDEIDRAELTSLRRLYQDPEPDSSDEVSARLEALNRRLCSDIRQGRFRDSADEARLRDHLRRSVEARVTLSNPKALKS
jgi:Domain of unknown function (DUF6285)